MSAGVLLWRGQGAEVEVLLGHPGGPFFAKKDLGEWSILKGEVEPGEDLEAVAVREFEEETGQAISPGSTLVRLGEIRQRGGKTVAGYAVRGDLDASVAVSNTFEMEWPPRSGTMRAFPEIDRVEWFRIDEARRRIKDAQEPFLDRLLETMRGDR